jgi:uncharacterized protein YkwD
MTRLALVVMLAAGCGGDDSGGSDAAHQAGVDATNMYRSLKGKPSLTYSAALEAYADEGAMHDFTTSPHDHFSSTGGGGIAVAENECPQQGNWQLPAGGDMAALVEECIKAFYDEGPGGGHYENMMGPYTTVGIGIYQSGTKVTIVQDFGN